MSFAAQDLLPAFRCFVATCSGKLPLSKLVSYWRLCSTTRLSAARGVLAAVRPNPGAGVIVRSRKCSCCPSILTRLPCVSFQDPWRLLRAFSSAAAVFNNVTQVTRVHTAPLSCIAMVCVQLCVGTYCGACLDALQNLECYPLPTDLWQDGACHCGVNLNPQPELILPNY
jgi:hypothetical protein